MLEVTTSGECARHFNLVALRFLWRPCPNGQVRDCESRYESSILSGRPKKVLALNAIGEQQDFQSCVRDSSSRNATRFGDVEPKG